MKVKTYRRKRGRFSGQITSGNNFQKGASVAVFIGGPGVDDSEQFTLEESWTPEVAKAYLLTMLVQAEQRHRKGLALIPTGDTVIENPGLSGSAPYRARARAKTKRKAAKKKTKKKATRRRNPSAKPADTRMRREYRATYTVGRARPKSTTFWALSDAAAVKYADGLLASRLSKGARVTRLVATKRTRRGPAKVSKKKVTRRRTGAAAKR